VFEENQRPEYLLVDFEVLYISLYNLDLRARMGNYLGSSGHTFEKARAKNDMFT